MCTALWSSRRLRHTLGYMTTPRPIRFVRRGRIVQLHGIAPDRTLLEILREDLGATGTKEGCGEGDCGACTVVLGEARQGRMHYQAVNSCIRLAHSIDGMALWTVEDLAHDPLIRPASGPKGSALHPVQEALVQCHGSQCGFCTPGFAMSLFGLYQNEVCQNRGITRTQAAEALSGNLCRCTGYRPILDAAQQMQQLPRVQVDETALLQQLELLAPTPQALEADFSYISPATLPDLLAARAAHPDAQLVAGATDLGLWITKQHRRFPRLLDVTRAAELTGVVEHDGQLTLGAAVSLTDAFSALQARWPQLHRFAARFAGLPVRNSGTLGGNVANGSPIGDSMPLLIALGAQVELASTRGSRRMPLEDFYTGYRQNQLAADELLTFIHLPLPTPDQRLADQRLAAYKVSKRFDDDISAVCLAIHLHIEGQTITQARIGAGGVAATPARARQTEAALTGRPWPAATAERAAAVLQAEFNPISDMRASGAYRREVLGALVRRFWRETRGGAETPALERLQPLTLEATP